MKFKDWFLIWPDYVISNSTFTCFGGPQKWNFFIDEKENPECTVESLKADIKNGWGPAEYEIDYIENVFTNTGNLTVDEDGDPTVELDFHFYICCKEPKKINTEKVLQEMDSNNGFCKTRN